MSWAWVLVASASGSAISSQPGWWLWLAPILFLLQLNSLNQSQELKLLKEPGAIWRAGLRAGTHFPRDHWLEGAMPGWVSQPSCIKPTLAHVKAVVTSKSTRALPGLLLEKQCGESQVTFCSSHIGKRVCLSQQTLPHPHFPCPGTALLSLAVHKPWAGPSA